MAAYPSVELQLTLSNENLDLVGDGYDVALRGGSLSDSSLIARGDNIQAAWWNIFAGPVKTAPSVTINHAWDGWFNLYNADAHLAEMQAVYLKRRMRFWSDPQDPDQSLGAAVPIVPEVWSGEFRLAVGGAEGFFE